MQSAVYVGEESEVRARVDAPAPSAPPPAPPARGPHLPPSRFRRRSHLDSRARAPSTHPSVVAIARTRAGVRGRGLVAARRPGDRRAPDGGGPPRARVPDRDAARHAAGVAEAKRRRDASDPPRGPRVGGFRRRRAGAGAGGVVGRDDARRARPNTNPKPEPHDDNARRRRAAAAALGDAKKVCVQTRRRRGASRRARRARQSARERGQLHDADRGASPRELAARPGD